MKQFILSVIACFVFIQSAKSQTSYTWNGATSTNWGTATNWTPNGIPGGNAGDNVTVLTGANTCKLNANTTIANITMTSGTLDLGGFTLSPTGNGVFTAGTIQNGTLTISGGAANTAALTNTTFAANSVLNITTGAITLNSGTYGGPVTLTQTGATSTSGATGGAVFSSSLSITNNSTGNFRMYGNNTYNGVCTFINGSSAGDFLPELNKGSTYNNSVTLTNTSTTSNMRMCYAGTTAFNGNIVLSNMGGANFTFCESATATATLATAKTISIGTFNVGALDLYRFTQVGSTAQNLTLTGSASIVLNNSTTFNGALTVNSPNLYTSSCTYNGVTVLTKTDGTTSNNFVGGNTFNNTLTLNYTAVTNPTAGVYWGFAASTPDIYNGNVYVNNSSADRILWGVGASTGTQFNGNLIVTQTGSAIGIGTAWSAGSTCTMAAGKTISIGGAGFTTGYLGISGLTTSSAVNITTTGTSAVYLGTLAGASPSTFGAAVTVIAPNIYLQGSTFNGVTTVTKTDGTTSNNSTGGNTFNNTLTINYTAATNPTTGVYLGFASGTPETYNGNVYVNNSSADRILWGVGASTGTQFNGNLIITQTGSALGIATAWSSGSTCTMAAGNTISIGAAGFTTGYLGISGLTTSSAVNLTTTGSSAVYIGSVSGNSIPSTFGSRINITAPDIYVRGGTFNARAYFTKNGGGSDHNNGFQNIFNASCNINQQSSGGYFMLGYNSNEQFNDSIIVTSTGTGGINLGWVAGSTGTPTLASGKSVFVGSAGFSAGYLRFGGFTQLGTVPINLTLTGTAALYINNTTSNSTFNAAFYITAPDIYVQGGTFNGRAYFTKTGGTSDNNNQIQNTFNASCNINQQSSSGYFMLGYNTNDLFNDSIIVSSTGTGAIYFGANNTTGTPTLASGKSIFVGSAGFSAGSLYFNHFTQLGSAAVNLTLTGTAGLYFQYSSVFGGNVTTNTPDVFFNGCTFNGTVNATKTGATSDAGTGGNTFNGVSTFNNTGAGYLMLGNGTADIWNAASTFNNSGSNIIYVGYNSTGNMFNGNITLTNTGSATGIQFCAGATATTTLSAGNTIQIGAAGYNTGYLNLVRFTQLGSATINLTLTGAATVIQVGPSSAIGGNFIVVSPRILLDGAVYSDTVNVTKNGVTGEWSTGGNTFNSTLIVNQLGSGFFGFANGSPDIYNGDVYANNNSTERIIFGNNPVGNMYNGNIILTQIGSSVGIAFGWSATTNETMAAGKTISIGAAGFSVGYLQIEQFTQLGNKPMNLLLTGTASLTFGPTSVIGGNVTSTSASLYFSGCTFNGTVNSTKNGATNDNSVGNNIFNAATIITNSGSGQLLFGNGNSDQFNSTSTFNNTGSNNIYVAWNSSNNIFGGVATFNNTPTANTGIYVSWNSTGTIFNSNIVVTSNNGIGVEFCGGNATATATLSAGNTISVGAGGFSAGTLLLQQFTQVGATAQALTLTGTGVLNVGTSSAFGGNVNFLSPQLDINGCTYSGTATLQANGVTNSTGTGGNIFNGVTVITNSGSGQFLTGNTNADQFNAPTTFNNTGGYRFVFANNHGGQTTTFASTLVMNSAKTVGGDNWSFFVCEGNNTNVTFGGAVTLNCSGSIQSNCRFVNGASSTATFNGNDTINVTNSAATQIQMGTTGTTTYNGNIIVSNSGGASGIYYNVNATASSTLANGQKITIGAGGFNAGGLYLYRFTQIGGTAQSLTLTGTANLTFGPTCAFGGNVTCSSPTLFFNGGTYSGTVNATKTGLTNDQSLGNNIFNAAATMTNIGSGYLMFGNGNADQFNAASTFNNTGSSNIYVAYNSSNNIFGSTATFNSTPTTNTPIYVSWLSTGTTFNGNIVVTSNNGGVQFCGGSATATAILSAGNTISVGAGGFSVGTLLLRQFTQTGGTAQSITLTGTGNLTFGPTSAFGGNVTCTSPTLLFNGCTFSGTTNCTKNGTTSDAGIGNNIFTGVSTINNSGVGYLMFGNGNIDQWITDVTFNNTGSSLIYPAYSSVGNSFGGNVFCNNVGSTGNATGIYFCSNTNATANVTGNLTVNNNPASGTNNGVRFCEANNTSFTVGGTSSITNTNTNTSNYIRFSNGTTSSTTFSGAVTVTNNGTVASTNVVHFGYTGTSIFNGGITLNSNGGTGIYFGSNGGISTQANNYSINTGAYTGGALYIHNFSQTAPATGNTSNVSITGTNQLLTFNGSTFYDNVTGSSQEITSTNSTFNSIATLTKASGNANDYWAGGNTFNGTTTITNQSTFILGMANGTADAYKGNVTFVQSGTGIVSPSYNANCTYAGNITVTTPAAIAMTFGAAAGGISTMNGSSATAQTINLTTGKTPIFTQFVMNNTGSGGVTLNTPISVSTSLALTSGLLNTTATNLLIMLNASTAPALTALSTSYINGPMKYQTSVTGSNVTLNFPVGVPTECRPFILTANNSVGLTLPINYTSQVFAGNAWAVFSSTTFPATVDTICGVHYWTCTRTDGNGTAQPTNNINGAQQIQLFFGTDDQAFNANAITVVKNTSATPGVWIDIGKSACSISNGNSTGQVGSITSSLAGPSLFNSFSSFTLGRLNGNTGWSPLPIELVNFNAVPDGENVDITWETSTEQNNNYFTIERSADGINFTELTTVHSKGINGNSMTPLNYQTVDTRPLGGVSYYRLKQTDYNNNSKYFNIISVDFDKKSFVSVYPNPASNNIYINVSSDYNNASLKFIDALGREILSQTISSSTINSINTGSLASGIYIMIIDNGNGEINKTKVTIQQ